MRRLALCAVIACVGALALPAAAPARHRAPPPVETFDFTSNLHPLGYSPQGNTPNLPGQTFTANSDLAFQGNLAFQGHYEGFRIINIASSANPREISFTDCNGNQGDLVVYGDILVRSWNLPAPAGATCDGQAVPTGFEGLHIFDISDLRDPELIGAAGCHDSGVILGDANLFACASGAAANVYDIGDNQFPGGSLTNPVPL